jgi:hypothetical protein
MLDKRTGSLPTTHSDQSIPKGSLYDPLTVGCDVRGAVLAIWAMIIL